MEIGGYRELDLRHGLEYYKGDVGIARLNSGRCGIYHALRILKCTNILIPYYQCSTVGKFLHSKGIYVLYYHINSHFLPVIENNDQETALLIVNYFGLIKKEDLENIAINSRNVIIDNTQAFFQKPIERCFNIYSPRKFVGVSDGCYVIGDSAELLLDEYEFDQSASTSLFLLSRIENGGNYNYGQYLKNEERIDFSDIRRMSVLTRCLLDNVDYDYVKQKRQKNYLYARLLFDEINLIDDNLMNKEDDAVPMVYPLIIENKDIRIMLKENSIFVGQWWRYVLEIEKANEWEKYLSTYLLPIQIDQRYGQDEIDYQNRVINKCL